jgi:hypothetical protein
MQRTKQQTADNDKVIALACIGLEQQKWAKRVAAANGKNTERVKGMAQ